MGQLNGQDDDNDHPCVWRSFFVIGARHEATPRWRLRAAGGPWMRSGVGGCPPVPCRVRTHGRGSHPLRRPLGHVGGDALGVARATHLLSRDEARRIVNIAKLPELLRPI